MDNRNLAGTPLACDHIQSTPHSGGHRAGRACSNGTAGHDRRDSVARKDETADNASIRQRSPHWRHMCWRHGECSINQNAAQCSVQVRPGSQQEKRPWRAHPLKGSTKPGRLRCSQVIYVDASTKGKNSQHEDYRPGKHNGCGWECLPMRSTEHISRWPKAAKRERRRDHVAVERPQVEGSTVQASTSM